MSKNFNAPPLSEQMVDENGFITTVWQEYLAGAFQTNEANATQFGLSVANVTTEQRNGVIDQNKPDTYSEALNQDSMPDGLMLYNKTTHSFDVRINGDWHTIDTTP